MYPSVGVKKAAPTHIVANFGQHPFSYDIDVLVQTPRSRDVYTIGWICYLPLELTAASLMLDVVHPMLPAEPTDQNTYVLGSIGHHNIVIVTPVGQYRTSSAAELRGELLSTFTAIRLCVLVGIGGGVPSPTDDIRLGDVVVGVPKGVSAGVIEYDLSGNSRRGQSWRPPPRYLSTVVSLFGAQLRTGFSLGNCFAAHITTSETATRFARPSRGDRLYKAEYQHIEGSDTCLNCDESQLVQRPLRLDGPVIHYGLIASGNQVLKDARIRDQLSKDNVLCVESAAAGFIHNVPSLVIRGISDYADSHKNHDWQGYAAAGAAAYAKKFLLAVDLLVHSNHKLK
ncbi:nucleoside phosphorylase domain-containing protein [Aspergillus californicus]